MHIEKPATHNFIEVDFQPQQLLPLQTLLNSNQSCQLLLNQVSQIININPASELATTLQAIAEKLRQFLDTQQVVIFSIHGNGSTVAANSLISSPNLNHTDSNHSIAVTIFTVKFSISGAIAILQHRLKQQQNRPGIEVVKEFGDIPLVECLASKINQVFISLLTNAIEALEEQTNYGNSFMPKIWISTEIVRSHLSLLSTTFALYGTQKQKVLIHIYDNGMGILPHIQRRMFEPFFTTKPIRKSMGLGLAISKQIIEQNHRGKIRCNCQLGHGTEFVIEIYTYGRHKADIKKHANF